MVDQRILKKDPLIIPHAVNQKEHHSLPFIQIGKHFPFQKVGAQYWMNIRITDKPAAVFMLYKFPERLICLLKLILQYLTQAIISRLQVQIPVRKGRSEENTAELTSRGHIVIRRLLDDK